MVQTSANNASFGFDDAVVNSRPYQRSDDVDDDRNDLLAASTLVPASSAASVVTVRDAAARDTSLHELSTQLRDDEVRRLTLWSAGRQILRSARVPCELKSDKYTLEWKVCPVVLLDNALWIAHRKVNDEYAPLPDSSIILNTELSKPLLRGPIKMHLFTSDRGDLRRGQELYTLELDIPRPVRSAQPRKGMNYYLDRMVLGFPTEDERSAWLSDLYPW